MKFVAYVKSISFIIMKSEFIYWRIFGLFVKLIFLMC